MILRNGLLFVCVMIVAGCSTVNPAVPHMVDSTQPAGADVTSDPGWPIIAKTLERDGVAKDGVYLVSIPRMIWMSPSMAWRFRREPGWNPHFIFIAARAGR